MSFISSGEYRLDLQAIGFVSGNIFENNEDGSTCIEVRLHEEFWLNRNWRGGLLPLKLKVTELCFFVKSFPIITSTNRLFITDIT